MTCNMDKKFDLDRLLSTSVIPLEVKNVVTFPLNCKGQHFTSFIQRVKVYLKNDKDESCIELIVKLLPSNGNDVETNTKLKFKKEIEFYRNAIPEYNRIQTNNKLPPLILFPLFYTASEETIVLQDLCSEGYFIKDDFINEEECKAVLRDLAKFHATGIALKLTNPEMFKEKLASVLVPALRNSSNPAKGNMDLEFRAEIKRLLCSNDELKNLAESVDSVLRQIDNTILPTPKEPFSTLLHNDLWRGNIMLKKSTSSVESFDVKFIDFQTVIFNSPARDLIYFLFSSVEVNVLSKFLELLKFYHFHFEKCVSDLGIDSSLFIFDNFVEEVNTYGPSKLKHLLLLFQAMCSVDVQKGNFEQYVYRIVTLFKMRGWL